MSEPVDLHKAKRRRPAPPPPPDALPPHSLEAEQGVMGCIFLSPQECMTECAAKLTTASWYDLRHQEIWDVLLEMFNGNDGGNINVITVQQRLKDKHRLEDVGGIAYLAALPDVVGSAAQLSFFITIVLEKAMLRNLVSTCRDIIGRVYSHTGTVEELMDEAERDVLEIRQSIVSSKEPTPIRDMVHSAINRFEDYLVNQGKLMGLSTGFPDIDKMLNGLRGNQMFVIAARPSVGKTSLAMNIAESVALDQGEPVGVFSLEMSADSLVERMICSRARVNLRNLREGFFSEREFPKITTHAGKLAASNVFIDDTSGLSILQLRAKARRMWQKHGIKLFVIDYLQLLHSTSRQAQGSREREIAEISGGVKALSKELDVPVIILAQLNRELEKQKVKKPTLAHLRESGAIEQDADIIGLLWSPKNDEDGSAIEQEATPATLEIAKQRNGPTGPVHLTFLKTYTRFESAAKITADDIPPDHPLFPTE